MASSADLINNLLTDLQFPRILLQKLDVLDSGIGILSLITISEEQLRDYLRLLDLEDTDFDSSYYYELLQSWRVRNKPAIQRLVNWCIYKDFAAEPPATPKEIIDPPVDVSCRAPCQSTASVIRTDILTEKQIFQAAASDTALVPLDISSGNCFVKSTLPAAEEERIISPSSGQATSRLSPPAINQISVGEQSQPLSLILSENRAPIENLSSNYFVIGLTEPSPEAPDSTCQLVPSAVRPQVSAVGQSQAQHIAQALSENVVEIMLHEGSLYLIAQMWRVGQYNEHFLAYPAINRVKLVELIGIDVFDSQPISLHRIDNSYKFRVKNNYNDNF
ncbi:uncharacterized protein LOC134210122 [Armigeres subalbatus]|uniref:uncharacterized protein LOC134210122 n=1 Tax=Armigeres subalbatus TaxID=124917 RepID=UPI002ED5856B